MMPSFYHLVVSFAATCVLGGCLSSPTEQEPLKGPRENLDPYPPTVTADSSTQELSSALPLFTPAQNREGWAQVLAGPTHELGHIQFQETLTPRWISSLGQGISAQGGRILSPPIVDRGNVYGMDSLGVVHAIAADSGAPLWTTETSPSSKKGYPVLGGGVSAHKDFLFVTTAFGELICLEAKTGAIVWRKSLASPARLAPTLDGEKIYVLTVDNQVRAFEQASGRLLWVHPNRQEQTHLLGTAAPAVTDRFVVVTYPSGEVVALKKYNGKCVWSRTIAHRSRFGTSESIPHIRAHPVISDGAVYVINYNGLLAALNLHNGQILWERAISGLEAPLVVDQFIFQITMENHLVCLNKSTGHVMWVKDLPKIPNFEGQGGWHGPILAQNLLYITGINGDILAINPIEQTGTGLNIKRSYKLLAGPTSFAPLVVDRRMYILTNSGEIEAFD